MSEIRNEGMEIARDYYLKQLTNVRQNGMIKIVTGIRRSGKSYLLFELFAKQLKREGIDDNHIVKRTEERLARDNVV